MHHNVYGKLVFSMQVAVMLSIASEDLTEGESGMTEQRARMQSRVMAVPVKQVDAVIFPVRQQPVQGVKRRHRVIMRHRISRVLSGQRFTPAIIYRETQ